MIERKGDLINKRLEKYCNSCDNEFGEVCINCSIREAQNIITQYSNFIESLLGYEDDIIFFKIREEAKFILKT